MMVAMSVIICSHNPREDYLPRVLEALRAQTLLLGYWELMLVDNASDAPLAGRFDLSWHPNARHVREEEIGLTHARLRGIVESRGDLLVFVDDDNVLRADYLEASLKISTDYPRLGAWGGSCIPEFEMEPPAELRPWLAGLVIEKLSAPVWAKLQKYTEACPMGAGMVVRRKVAAHYRDLALHNPVRQALGRSGKKLGGGEDGDMALCGFELGLGTGRFPELELTHLIPAQRLALRYFEGIHEGFGYSSVVIEAIHKNAPAPGRVRAGALRIFLLRILLFVTGKNRAERRIRLAMKKGALRASRDLNRLDYLRPPPAG